MKPSEAIEGRVYQVRYREIIPQELQHMYPPKVLFALGVYHNGTFDLCQLNFVLYDEPEMLTEYRADHIIDGTYEIIDIFDLLPLCDERLELKFAKKEKEIVIGYENTYFGEKNDHQ